jgi:hypothetical protein
MDSGDLGDQTLYAEPARKLFAGKLLCVIRGIAPGPATATFRAAGLGEAALDFTVG